MKVQLRLKFTCVTRKFAEAIQVSLAPDNVAFPSGLSMTTSVSGRVLEIRLKSSGRIETLLSTVDEVLSNIQTSEETLTRTL